MSVTFTVPGEPQGKARARTGKGFFYTPEKTVLYENLIKMSYSQKYRGADGAKFETIPGTELKQPVGVTIRAYHSIPRSYGKGKRLAATNNLNRPTRKPDADNIAKVICDALNGLVYIDDTQVVKLTVEKLYGEPRVEVEIEVI